MGQKTHPTGFRIAVTEPWRSRWYASKKDFAKFLLEDNKIRRFIKKEWQFAAIPRVEIERTGERRSGHALTPVPFTDIAARDPPVWRGRLAFFVRRAALDPGHLVGRAELAPAHAVVAVVHEGGMRPAFSHPALLGGAVVLWVRSGVIVMEAHAPAAAKDAVVALHQRSERGPRRLIEGPHGVRRFGHEVQPNPVQGMSPFVPN